MEGKCVRNIEKHDRDSHQRLCVLIHALGVGSLWCLERKCERSSIFSALRGAVGWLGDLCTTASNSEKVALSCWPSKAICLVRDRTYEDGWLGRALPLNQSVLAKGASAL